MVVTADHGFVPSPEVSGAFLVLDGELALDLEAVFDPDGSGIIVGTHTTQTFLDVERLEAAGHTVEEVAAFIASYTKADNAEDASTLGPDELDDLLFPVAVPGEVLERTDCRDVG